MSAFLSVPMSRRCLCRGRSFQNRDFTGISAVSSYEMDPLPPVEAETVDLVEGTDDTFRCCIKTINFFGKTLMPVVRKSTRA